MTTPQRQNALVTITTNPQSAKPLTLKLVITTPVVRGQPIVAKLVAEGGTGGYIYSISASFGSALPTGTGPLDSITGIIPGTPTAIGHFPFTASVQDSSSTVTTASFVIDVVSSLTPRDVNPIPGEIGLAYAYQLTVYGATGTVSWTLLSGNLPAGCASLPTSGLVSSAALTTPQGFSYAKVRATDSGSGDTLDINLTFQVVTAVSLPGMQTFDFIAGVPASFQVDLGTDGLAPLRIVATPDGRDPWPPWMTISPSGLLHSDNPVDVAGGGLTALIFGVNLSDAAGGVDSGVIVVRVRQAQTIVQPMLSGGGVGAPGPRNFSFTGPLIGALTNDGTTVTITVKLPVQTGWAASTGTASKAAYATYTAPTIGVAYNATVQGQLQTALAHIVVLSQQFKAMKDALIALGAIGP